MSKNIVYVGPDDVRKISAADWVTLGITGMGDSVWQQSNSYEQLVTDSAAAWLLAQHGEFIDEGGLTFPAVIDGLSGSASVLQGEKWSYNMLYWNSKFASVMANPTSALVRSVSLMDSIGELGSFDGAWLRLEQLVPFQAARSQYGAGWSHAGGSFGMSSGTGTAHPGGAGAGPDGYGMVMNNGVDTGLIGAFLLGGGIDVYGSGTFDIYTTDGLVVANQVLTTGVPYVINQNLVLKQLRMVSKANGSVFHGCYGYSSAALRTAGYQHWQFAHSGWTTDNFNNNPDSITFINNLAPDLVVLETGINDDSAGANAYDTRMRTLINSIKAVKPLISISLWLPHQGGSSHPNNAAIVEKGKKICADYGIMAMNMREVMGSTEAGTSAAALALSSDTVHYTTAGSELNGQFVFARLSAGFRKQGRPIFESQAALNLTIGDGTNGTAQLVPYFNNGEMTWVFSDNSGSQFSHSRVWGKGANFAFMLPRFSQVEKPFASANDYVVPDHYSRTTLALVVNTEYAIPFYMNYQLWGLLELGFELVTAGSAGAVARVLLRDSAGTDNKPGNKVANAESGTLATTGAAGAIASGALTASNLAEGLYYLCIVAQVAACTVRATANPKRQVTTTGFPTGAAPVRAGFTKTGVSGTPSTSYGTPAAIVDTIPLIGFKTLTALK